MKQNKNKSKKSHKCISVISTVVIVVLVLLISYLLFCNYTNRVAFFGNRAVIKIVSQSMEPTIPTGEYIVVEKIKAEDISSININDVIVFYSRDPSIYGKLNTHRVIDIVLNDNGTKFITKGDNNAVKDELATNSEDVVGRYVKNADGVTKIAGFIMQKWSFFILILIPAAIIVMLCIKDVIKKTKEVKMDILVQERVEQLREEEKNKNNKGGN